VKLSNIKTSRIPNRVNLVFSDQSYLPFFIDDVVKLSLVKNQELDSEKLDLIINSSLKYLGKEYALRQIAISPKSEKILSQKINQFFFRATQKFKLFSDYSTSQIINEIVTELKDRNLLNKSDFAAYFIKKNKNKSQAHVRFLLQQQGIISDISTLDDQTAIKKILSKKRITQEFLSDFNLKNKLFASLFRSGFQISDIKAAIDDYLQLQ
jgi:SOS response regulatory protein OraA/RecX